jgi:hypothetical protein
MSSFGRTTPALVALCAYLCAVTAAPVSAMTGHAATSGRASSSHARAKGFTSATGARSFAAAPFAGRGAIVVTRPAPPFHTRFVCPHCVIIVEPFFLSHRRFVTSDRRLFLSPGPPLAVIDAPFFCWLDGLGFADREQFARHLHDAHGVPLANALSFGEHVGGRFVFFGF